VSDRIFTLRVRNCDDLQEFTVTKNKRIPFALLFRDNSQFCVLNLHAGLLIPLSYPEYLRYKTQYNFIETFYHHLTECDLIPRGVQVFETGEDLPESDQILLNELSRSPLNKFLSCEDLLSNVA
jgi:hypothetical protein